MELAEAFDLIERLRAENEYLRAQMQVFAPPKYISGRWLRVPGDHIQPQMSRHRGNDYG